MSSSRSRLSEDLLRVREISHIDTGEQSSIIQGYKNKVEQNLQMKEKFIELETKLKMTEEQLSLQTAEFSFRKTELESEIKSLRSIESELRETIINLTNEKNEAIRQSESKLRSAIAAHEISEKEAFDSFQEEIRKLREENANLQVNQEVIAAENRRLTLHNEGLNDHFHNAEELANKRIEVVRDHLEGDSAIIAKLRDQIITLTANYENEKGELNKLLIAEQQKSALYNSELQIALEKQKSLETQAAELKKANDELSTRIVKSASENGMQKTLIEQLKNEKMVLEMKANREKALAIDMENRVNEFRGVSSCSPLLRTRISILKVFDREWNTLKHELVGHTNFNMKDVLLSVLFTLRWQAQHKAIKEDQQTVFTPEGGLQYFTPRVPRTMMHTCIKQIANHQVELEHKCLEMEAKIYELENHLQASRDKKNRKKQEKEAVSLKLKSAIKCNSLLHKHMKTMIPE